MGRAGRTSIPTTQALVPRALRTAPSAKLRERLCWRLWIPAFTVVYRISNFWNLPRLARMDRVDPKPRRRQRGRLARSPPTSRWSLGVGPRRPVGGVAVGPRLVLGSLVLIEPIMMSQHTHVPQQLANGTTVAAHPAPEQVRFTRSLVFPAWFSKIVLLGFDAHELHHAYPAVPGYRLSSIDWEPPGRFVWWRWILRVRAMPGEGVPVPEPRPDERRRLASTPALRGPGSPTSARGSAERQLRRSAHRRDHRPHGSAPDAAANASGAVEETSGRWAMAPSNAVYSRMQRNVRAERSAIAEEA